MTGVGLTAAAPLVAVVLAGPILGVGGRYYRDRSGAGDSTEDEQFLSRLTTATFVSLCAVALVAVAWERPAGTLAAAAGVVSPVPAALADAVLAVGVVELGLRGFHRPLEPVYRGTRGPDYEYPPENRRTVRVVRLGGLLAAALPVTLSAAGVGSVGTLAIGLWVVLVFAGMRVALYGAVENGGTFMRLPTADERARIAACCERFGLAPARVALYTGDRHDTEVYHGGFGDGRTVRLPERLLEIDDDALAVALAQAEGKYRNRQRLFAQIMSLGAVAAILGLVGAAIAVLDTGVGQALGGVPGTVAIAAVAVAAFGAANRLSRRRVFAADRFASDRLGAETVRDAYHRHGAAMSALDQDLDPDSLESRIRYEPSMVDRIARLDAPPREDEPEFLEGDEPDEGSTGRTPRGPPRDRPARGQREPRRDGPQSRDGQRRAGDRSGRQPRDGPGGGPTADRGENPHAPPSYGGEQPSGADRGRGRRGHADGAPEQSPERSHDRQPQAQRTDAHSPPRADPQSRAPAGPGEPAPDRRPGERAGERRRQPQAAQQRRPPDEHRRNARAGQPARDRDRYRARHAQRSGGLAWALLATAQLSLLAGTVGIAILVETLGPTAGMTVFEMRALYQQVVDFGSAVIVLATFVVPVGVYYERKRAPPRGWRPSRAYYLAAVPILGALVACAYLIDRARSDG